MALAYNNNKKLILVISNKLKKVFLKKNYIIL